MKVGFNLKFEIERIRKDSLEEDILIYCNGVNIGGFKGPYKIISRGKNKGKCISEHDDKFIMAMTLLQYRKEILKLCYVHL